MVEKEPSDGGNSTPAPIPQSQSRPRCRLKTIVIGIGATLVIIGIVLAYYVAMNEDEPFLIALAPAFIGLIVIIAALFGKKL